MKKILIVEDEIVVALNLKSWLARMNFSVLPIVSHGEKAVNVSKAEKPNIILMDINLASRMNGIEAAKEILKYYDPFIIFMTGSSDKNYFDQIESMGALLIRKPYYMEQILTSINRYLNMHPNKAVK